MTLPNGERVKSGKLLFLIKTDGKSTKYTWDHNGQVMIYRNVDGDYLQPVPHETYQKIEYAVSMNDMNRPKASEEKFSLSKLMFMHKEKIKLRNALEETGYSDMTFEALDMSDVTKRGVTRQEMDDRRH